VVDFREHEKCNKLKLVLRCSHLRLILAPDPNYRFELVKTIPGAGYRAFVLDLTSQAWRAPAEVDRTVLIKPDTVKGTTAFLFPTGGSTSDKAPERVDPARSTDLRRAARTHGRASPPSIILAVAALTGGKELQR